MHLARVLSGAAFFVIDELVRVLEETRPTAFAAKKVKRAIVLRSELRTFIDFHPADWIGGDGVHF